MFVMQARKNIRVNMWNNKKKKKEWILLIGYETDSKQKNQYCGVVMLSQKVALWYSSQSLFNEGTNWEGATY